MSKAHHLRTIDELKALKALCSNPIQGAGPGWPRCESLERSSHRGEAGIGGHMKLLVCGGRDYDNQDWVFQYLDEFAAIQLESGFRIKVVITGFSASLTSAMKTWRQLAAPVPARTSCT